VKATQSRDWRTNDAAVKRTWLVSVEALERDEMKDAVHGVVRPHNTNVSALHSAIKQTCTNTEPFSPPSVLHSKYFKL